MHNSTSEKAREIVRLIEELENEDPFILTIDAREIMSAASFKEHSAKERCMKIVLDLYRGIKHIVHKGIAVTYTPPIRLYSYDHLKEWKRAAKIMVTIEKQARESLRAQEDNMDITGMMGPAKFKMRKGYLSFRVDSDKERRAPWLLRHGEKKTGTRLDAAAGADQAGV